MSSMTSTITAQADQAISDNQTDIFSSLVKSGSFKVTDLYNLLLSACKRNRIEVVKQLLKCGCPVNVYGSEPELVMKWSSITSNASSSSDISSQGTPSEEYESDNDVDDPSCEILARACWTNSHFISVCDGLELLQIDNSKSDTPALLACNHQVVNNTVDDGYTPLHFTVKNKNLDIAEELLKCKADIYRKDAQGSAPIDLAYHQGDLPMIDLLSKYNCATETLLRDYAKKMIKAVKKNQVLNLNMLLDDASKKEGFDIEDLTYNLLKMSIYYKNYDVSHHLLESCPVNLFSTQPSNSPLHIAVTKKGALEIVKILLSRGAWLSETNANGDTPIHLAFRHNITNDITDLLLDHYYHPWILDVVNNQGLSLLHIACNTPKLQVIQALLEKGRSAINGQITGKNDPSCEGYTPLHFAVMSGQYDVAEWLLTHGASMLKPDANGCTPVHLACKYRDIKMIKLLFSFDYGCRNPVNKYGLSHFMAACIGDVFNIAEGIISLIRCTGGSSLVVRSHLNNLLDARVSIWDPYTKFAGYNVHEFVDEFSGKEIRKLIESTEKFCK